MIFVVFCVCFFLCYKTSLGVWVEEEFLGIRFFLSVDVGKGQLRSTREGSSVRKEFLSNLSPV